MSYISVSDELAPIADKLRQYVRLLSSDVDGEVIAAARALNRTLKNSKLDIHALADGICVTNGKKFSEDEAKEIYFKGVEKGRRQAENRPDPKFHNVSEHDQPSWHDIACECAIDRLRNDTERKFIQDMVRRTARAGHLSEKQQNWLRDCFIRMHR
jgi:hypothetical protein